MQAHSTVILFKARTKIEDGRECVVDIKVSKPICQVGTFICSTQPLTASTISWDQLQKGSTFWEKNSLNKKNTICKYQVLNRYLKDSCRLIAHSLWAFCAFWRHKGSSSNVPMAAISTRSVAANTKNNRNNVPPCKILDSRCLRESD